MAMSQRQENEWIASPEKDNLKELQGTTILQVPTPIWLHEMSQKYKEKGLIKTDAPDFTLGTVPDHEWDEIAKRYDSIYFLTVYKRSQMGREHALIYKEQYKDSAEKDYKEEDVISSGFAHIGYDHLDPIVVKDDWNEFDRVVSKKLHPRGLKVGVDFIPHITGMDHPKVGKDHTYFVRGTPQDFIARPSLYMKKVFYDEKGEPYYIAHGNDQHGGIPWTDTAKINLANPRVQEEVAQDAVNLVTKHNVDFLRFDMAHLATKEDYPKTCPNPLTMEEYSAIRREDLWDILPSRVKKAAKGVGKKVWFIAEAYDHENELLDHGIDFVYDHMEYFRIEKQVAREQLPAEAMANYLKFGTRLARSIHYQSNHDEPRADAMEGLGDAKRARAFAAVSAFRNKGIWLVYDGQQRGVIIRPPAQLRRVRKEPTNSQTESYFDRLLSLRKDPLFRQTSYTTPAHESADDSTYKNLIVQQSQGKNRGAIICTNLSWDKSRGKINLPSNAGNIRMANLETGEIMDKNKIFQELSKDRQYLNVKVDVPSWESLVVFYDLK